MKLCQMCRTITADEQNYCAHDGQPLAADTLATALQESVGAKYTITRLIGTGSMGAVYRAQHHALGDVAIKVMLGPPDNHKLSARFLREAKALRKLHNPHSVLVYDLERSATGLTYMVMEMVEGRSLREELKERGHLSLEETIAVAEAVCDALEAAHERGIIHRDLKPDNILLTEEKTTDGQSQRLIKIVDFGIVKLRGTQQGGEETSMQLTKYGSPIGTPFYMSPEQWFGDGPPGFTGLDGRTDIYALGCTLYESLAGSPPFVGKTKEEMRRLHLEEDPRPLSEIAPHVPEEISRIIMRTLAKDRDFRPDTATEFATELRSALNKHLHPPILKGAPEGLSTTPESFGSAAGWPTPEQISALQATEETVPVVRNWAAEEAQPVIEQVRERPLSRPQASDPHTLGPADAQSATGQMLPAQLPVEVQEMEDTLVPDTFDVEEERRVEPEQRAPTTVEPKRQPTFASGTPSPHAPVESKAVMQEDESAASRDGYELMLAQAGAWNIGLLADEVESVAAWRAAVPLPGAPPAVLGVVSVRGRMLTVLDPAALLGDGSTERAESTAHSFLIVLKGDEQLALAVSRLDGNIGIYLGEIVASTASINSGVARGVIQGAHGQTIVLDARELFAAAMQGAERRRQRLQKQNQESRIQESE
jgi:serine/threonine protein kinase/chemotaxis signal transduction protein